MRAPIAYQYNIAMIAVTGIFLRALFVRIVCLKTSLGNW
jgi:hypothetical protein